MFIKNKTENWQSFSVGGKNIFLAPEGDAKDTIAIGDEFADDPILTLLLGKDVLEKVKRFDMKGFRPPKPYIRELKRYGVLPGSFDDEKDPIDPYETDRLYWALDWTSLR